MKPTKRHYHRATPKVDVIPFTGCVAPNKCNPKAHGWAITVDFCYAAGCEAIRHTAVNGGNQERGTWFYPAQRMTETP